MTRQHYFCISCGCVTWNRHFCRSCLIASHPMECRPVDDLIWEEPGNRQEAPKAVQRPRKVAA